MSQGVYCTSKGTFPCELFNARGAVHAGPPLFNSCSCGMMKYARTTTAADGWQVVRQVRMEERKLRSSGQANYEEDEQEGYE